MLSRLRIGWATPWNYHSAIAHVAEDVAAELTARGHDVTVLRTETGAALALPPRASSWPIYPLADVATAALHRDFDVVVAHIGNNFPYHGALLPRLPALGVVGIFHDAFLANLAAGLAHQPGGGGDAMLRRVICQTYGEAAWPAGEPFLTWASMEDVARRRPMLEWIAGQTVGAVAHAEHYAARLRAACPGPAAVIPLALAFHDLPPPPASSNRMVVAVIGHANPNKRIDQLILAISASPLLRRRCRVRVIGEAAPDERERLDTFARIAGIAPPEFTGWVSDEDLRWRLRDVDAICCLRHPVLEGASASLVLAMASGRPTLVSGQGCYAEVPDDAVMVCSPGGEALDVMRHLERLVTTPALGIAMGVRAQAIAARRHSPTAYVAALLPLLEQAIAARPLVTAGQRLAETLGEFGLAPGDPAMLRITDVLAGMRHAENKE